jgi:hypothetical protein
MRNGELRDADWMGQVNVQQRIAALQENLSTESWARVDTRSLRMAAHIPLRWDK